MKKLSLLSFIVVLCSCAENKPEEETAEPVEQPQVGINQSEPTVAPLPVAEVDPTAAFLTPKQDRNLPSKDQLAEGTASIGTDNTVVNPLSNQPTTSIKPPAAPSLEDQLAPAE